MTNFLHVLRTLSLLLCLSFSLQGTAQSVFINELHYDNASTDVNEGIEVAGPAGTDLTGWSLVLYNGNNGAPYDTKTLSGTLTDQSGGYGFAVANYPSNGIQNSAPDGVALVNAQGTVVQFLSYEGTFTAVGGPADGLVSTDIGVSQAGSGPGNFSLQLAGEGNDYLDFAWVAEAASTFGAVNSQQRFQGSTAPGPDPQPDPEPTMRLAFINEIHYDNVGADVGEGVEIAGLAGTDLAGWQLVPYNGANGQSYSPLTLTGVIPSQQNGFGALFFAISGLQNGEPDGIALVDEKGNVVQFLSYEGAFAATNGPASGLTSTDMGVAEDGATPIGYSLQLTGTGSAYEGFNWTTAATATYNSVNNNQTFLPLQDMVFINEIHYDNAGIDAGEGVEVAGNAGADLSGWQLLGYNGNNGAVYQTVNLSGTIPNQQNGYGTVFFQMAGLQNGKPDGVALVNADGEVVQFLSYEGVFTAVGGAADGMESTDIGVAEDGNTPIGFSLQLTGSGFTHSDFTWSSPIASTYNAVNTGQRFGAGEPDPEPEPEPREVTIAEARNLPLGAVVIINGTLTATSQLGGPAYIQDETAGIPLFDFQVHGPSSFSIGDSIQVTASIGQFNQQLQLVDVTELERLGAATQPVPPAVVTIAELGAYEGQLVTIRDAAFTDTRGLLFPESNYSISDGTGTTAVRIDGDVDSLVGRLIPQTAVDITGVVGSFRGSLQVFPRFIQDLPGTVPYQAAGSDIPISTTLDVMTWNMEFFGATQANFGPSDVQLQLQNAKTLIDSVNADIIAVQEISDENLLQQLVDMLPNYTRICSERYSYSFEGPDPSFPAQKVCFLYKNDVITVLNDRVLFEATYDSARIGYSTVLDNYPTGSPSSFWSSGRLPYLLTVDATLDGVTERFELVNIHAKSGATAADLRRRFYDVQALKDTLDAYYPDANILLLGDYNDDVDESIGGGASTYTAFVQDSDFRVVTSTLSEAGLRSFITQDNVIDHITISNELYDNYLVGSETLIIPFSLITNFANTTSDHLPVLTRFELTEPLKVDAGQNQVVFYGYAPAACATLAAGEATGGVPGYTYTWSTGETGRSIQVCPRQTTVYTLTVTDARGVSYTDEVQVCVVDVSCGNDKNPSVQVFLNPSGQAGKGKVMCVSEKAVPAMLAVGATLGDGSTYACDGTPLQPAAVSLADLLKSLQVYPNPVSEKLNIAYSLAEELEVEILLYNGQGKLVYQQNHHLQEDHLSLDVRKIQLSKGVNYLHINSKYGKQTIRILKN